MSPDDDSWTSSDSSSAASSSSESSEEGGHDEKRRGRGDSTASSDASGGSTDSDSSSDDSVDDDGSSDDDEIEEDTPLSNTPWYCLFGVVALAAVITLVIVLFRDNEKSSGSSTDEPGGGQGPTTKAGGTSASATTARSTTTSANGPAGQATGTVDNAFLDSLASSYSMTPAATASLAMPTAAIGSANEASQYIEDSWTPSRGGAGDFVAFVADPFEKGGDGGSTVLEVKYKQGHYTGAENSGGVANLQMPVFSAGKQRAIINYEVAFSEGFDFVQGGKLPGAYGGDPAAGCTGGKHSTECFSLRTMWREKGGGEVYGYIPLYDDECEDTASKLYCHEKYGVSIQRDSFQFVAGSWNTVTQVVVLNSDPSTNGVANGQLTVYAGETLAFELKNLVFRVDSSVTLSNFIFATFFGGSSASYAATADCSTYYRNMRFWEGDDPSDADGRQVTVLS